MKKLIIILSIILFALLIYYQEYQIRVLNKYVDKIQEWADGIHEWQEKVYDWSKIINEKSCKDLIQYPHIIGKIGYYKHRFYIEHSNLKWVNLDEVVAYMANFLQLPPRDIDKFMNDYYGGQGTSKNWKKE